MNGSLSGLATSTAYLGHRGLIVVFAMLVFAAPAVRAQTFQGLGFLDNSQGSQWGEATMARPTVQSSSAGRGILLHGRLVVLRYDERLHRHCNAGRFDQQLLGLRRGATLLRLGRRRRIGPVRVARWRSQTDELSYIKLRSMDDTEFRTMPDTGSGDRAERTATGWRLF